jgi:Transcriptional regulatory protein, C terminal
MCLTGGSQNPNGNLLFCGFLHGTVGLTATYAGEDIVRYLFEDCVLDTDRRELRRGADLLSVTPQVFDVLAYLIRNRERVVSKDDLIAVVLHGRTVSYAVLTTRINVAGNAIGDSDEDQRLIKTLTRIAIVHRTDGSVKPLPCMVVLPCFHSRWRGVRNPT